MTAALEIFKASWSWYGGLWFAMILVLGGLAAFMERRRVLRTVILVLLAGWAAAVALIDAALSRASAAESAAMFVWALCLAGFTAAVLGFLTAKGAGRGRLAAITAAVALLLVPCIIVFKVFMACHLGGRCL